jgi:hypothetical protein
MLWLTIDIFFLHGFVRVYQPPETEKNLSKNKRNGRLALEATVPLGFTG